MKQIFVMFALLLGVCAANAQTTDTVKYAAGNDLYRGITRKLPNKRPYKRGYRVHEDGVCRREYGNEDRTARTTSRRKSETETGNGKQR